MGRLQPFVRWTGAVMVAALTACADNPTGSSGEIVLRGTVVGLASASASASSERAASGAGRIIVTVQEDPSLSTTVSGSGTFELNGLPEGGFTLVFTTSNGVTLGTITVTGAEPGQEIRITVQVTSTTVILIEIVNAGGDDESDGEGDEEGDATCAISGGKVGRKIELEGNVQSGTAEGFDMKVNGNRVKNGAVVHVTTTGASFKCNGNSGGTDCRGTVKPTANIHVSGMLTACDLAAATVAANQVKVQKP